MLLIASYVFYGSWDWRFLLLIFFSTVLDYLCGKKIYELDDLNKKKFFLTLSIVGNLSVLGFFKYFNFFHLSFQNLAGYFGITVQPQFLNVILPVGISFYTFQTMSYTIDIYRKKMNATNNFFDFALFVAFFPQLVAGPIERASSLLPQILKPRKLSADQFFSGIHLIFWGVFQKIFIADNLAKIVDVVFDSGPNYNGIEVLIALYAFAFQIYCDFAGYSNIARGIGSCMGFKIMVNFNLPYFATNPSDFWRRWHIGLSTWLKDYLYIPLGGNRKGALTTYRNLFITMLLGGLWHGASWKFIAWGAYHGILLMGYRFIFITLGLFKKKTLIGSLSIFKVICFFHLTCIGWLIFRAESLIQAVTMFKGIFLNFEYVQGSGIDSMFSKFMFFTWILLIVQLIQYWKDDILIVMKMNLSYKTIFYYVCFALMFTFGVSSAKQFIYFQF